jgi:hypothetical protein
MKGITFQKPFEFQLKVDGETWNQGATISGTLEIKNRGSQELPLGDARVSLATGKLSKVHKKSPDAFDVIATSAADSSRVLKPEASISFPWSFETDRNCQITDSLKSLFLIYGMGEAADKLGQLQLPIHPAPIIEEFLKRFEIGFRFVQKARKSSKGRVEIKLAPPDGNKAFSNIEHVIMHFRMEGDDLEIEYEFHMTRVEATPVSSEVKKFTTEVEQRITRDEYLLPSGRVNFDFLEGAIREALAQVERTVTF